MRTVAVVLAAGSGNRFGAARPKQLSLLAGRTLVEHSVRAFDRAPAVDEVLVVAAAGIEAEVRRDCAGYPSVAAVIRGGTTRTDSTRQALGWLTSAWQESGDQAEDWKVLIHDAARPLVDQRTIAESVSALDRWQAVGVVVASADTIVEVCDGTIRRVLPRDTLARCQTPQGFRLSVLSTAYQLAGADPGFGSVPATDDCGVVLRYLPDVPVGAVAGSERNLKITYPADLTIAAILLDAADSAP
jgi:2-C-methyl-D-erythritol 4-phosphate cytidylyltransferase